MTNRIMEYLNLRHASKRWLSMQVGVNISTMRKYITGQSRPPIDVAYAMCDALRTDIYTLFPREAET